MGATMSANVVNLPLISDLIIENFVSTSTLKNLIQTSDKLQGKPGDEEQVPWISDDYEAQELTEGQAITPRGLTQNYVKVKIKEIGDAIEVTDRSSLIAAYSPEQHASLALGSSIAKKSDKDIIATWDKTTRIIGDGTKNFIDLIPDVYKAAGEKFTSFKAIVIHSTQVANLMGNSLFTDASKLGKSILIDGVKALGTLYGLPVIVSDKAVVESGTIYHSYFVMNNSALLSYKRDVNIETDRDILKRTTLYVSTMHYGIELLKNGNGTEGVILVKSK